MIDKEFIASAHELAEIAGEIARFYFRSNNVETALKNAKSLVTEADLKIENEIRKYLNIKHPKHSVLGEEYGSSNKNSEYLWVIDPIDGTTSFICGKPTFCTLIALLHNNKPILGIIDQPINNERWLGEIGKNSKFNNAECSNNLHETGLLRLNCTTPMMFSNKQREIFESVQTIADISCYGGDAYGYGLMASGHIDIIMEADLKFYDVAALIPVIKGTGGQITDWHGNELNNEDFNGTVLASRTMKIHEKILNIIS